VLLPDPGHGQSDALTAQATSSIGSPDQHGLLLMVVQVAFDFTSVFLQTLKMLSDPLSQLLICSGRLFLLFKLRGPRLPLRGWCVERQTSLAITHISRSGEMREVMGGRGELGARAPYRKHLHLRLYGRRPPARRCRKRVRKKVMPRSTDRVRMRRSLCLIWTTNNESS